jgi:arylsulfatase A-like enzyme
MNAPDLPGDFAVRVPPSAATRSAWRRLVHSAWQGARFALAAAFGLWVGDVVLLATSRRGATPLQWLTGVGGALFVAATTALFTGVLLGPALVPVAARVAATLRPRWEALRNWDQAAHRDLAAGVVTLLPLVCTWTWLGDRAVLALEFDFARPDTIAGAITLAWWFFAATLVTAWIWSYPYVRAWIEKGSTLPGLRWLFERAWVLPAVVLMAATVGVAAAVAAFLAAYMKEFSALPWRNAVPLVGLVLGVAGATYLPSVRPPWGSRLARAACLLGALAFTGGTVAAVRLRPESTRAHRLAFERTLSGRIGYAAWTAAFDFDRDGQLGFLGGGDCAPFDPTRYTGAVEIPGNGVDEDCDGADLQLAALNPRPATSFIPAALPSRPTIIFLTVDALGAPRLTALGSPKALMPNLDDFAKRSMLFTHCFSQGPSTRLSFPSMFTSHWDSELTFEAGARLPYSFSAKQPQIQDILDDAGYQTIAVIPNDYFDRSRWPSVTRGFQQVVTSPMAAGKHDAPQVTDAVLRVLSESHDRPLYLWAHYYDAHPPYQTLPGVHYPEYGAQPLYEAELTYIDREMGRLLTALEQRSEPTYVIITADHSTVFHPDPVGHPHHYGYDLYTATLHVPLIVHGPGLRMGRSEGIVSTMDVAPTIVDFVRVFDRSRFQGTSLLRELVRGQEDPNRALFHEFYLPERLFHGYDPLEMVSVRRGRWDLILNRVSGTYELYDWTADYFEQSDLYEEQAREPEVLQLKSQLGAFIQQHGRTQGATLAAPATDRRFQSNQGEP